MIDKIINKSSKKNCILLVPLDWGLGHATRCIPLIREFEANGCEVIIAAENPVKSLLQHEFQHLTFIPLKGYGIRYSVKSHWLPLKILSQLPRILHRIYKEHKWLKKVVKKYSVTAIISDNRFGLYHSHIPSVYITHQLLIKTGGTFSEKIARQIHGWFINKYTFCWIPDFEGMINIGGELSHPSIYPSNTKFIGCLSRFEKKAGFEKNNDLLIIISGPEPQRTIFEELLLPQLRQYKGKTLVIRGLPGIEENDKNALGINTANSHLVIKNHLSARELNDEIEQSALIISRSGYTTIMDLIKLKQKAVLVPTPGQTEQEYLAGHLMKQHFFFTTRQAGFILTDVLKQAAEFPFAVPFFDMDQYKKVVYQFVQTL
ncbi:MAG: glycosyl transferase family 28 [Ferruginibacter sp.]|nr:glycosyl transferase family 28 [Ferruginibacter sp.]